MTGPTLTCPHCAADLRGEPIPSEYIAAGHYGSSTHYMRTIGVEIRGVYDGVLFWRCPDCGDTWNRWPEGSQRHAVAEKYMAQAVIS